MANPTTMITLATTPTRGLAFAGTPPTQCPSDPPCAARPGDFCLSPAAYLGMILGFFFCGLISIPLIQLLRRALDNKTWPKTVQSRQDPAPETEATTIQASGLDADQPEADEAQAPYPAPAQASAPVQAQAQTPEPAPALQPPAAPQPPLLPSPPIPTSPMPWGPPPSPAISAPEAPVFGPDPLPAPAFTAHETPSGFSRTSVLRSGHANPFAAPYGISERPLSSTRHQPGGNVEDYGYPLGALSSSSRPASRIERDPFTSQLPALPPAPRPSFADVNIFGLNGSPEDGDGYGSDPTEGWPVQAPIGVIHRRYDYPGLAGNANLTNGILHADDTPVRTTFRRSAGGLQGIPEADEFSATTEGRGRQDKGRRSNTRRDQPPGTDGAVDDDHEEKVTDQSAEWSRLPRQLNSERSAMHDEHAAHRHNGDAHEYAPNSQRTGESRGQGGFVSHDHRFASLFPSSGLSTSLSQAELDSTDALRIAESSQHDRAASRRGFSRHSNERAQSRGLASEMASRREASGCGGPNSVDDDEVASTVDSPSVLRRSPDSKPPSHPGKSIQRDTHAERGEPTTLTPVNDQADETFDKAHRPLDQVPDKKWISSAPPKEREGHSMDYDPRQPLDLDYYITRFQDTGEGQSESRAAGEPSARVNGGDHRDGAADEFRTASPSPDEVDTMAVKRGAGRHGGANVDN